MIYKQMFPVMSLQYNSVSGPIKPSCQNPDPFCNNGKRNSISTKITRICIPQKVDELFALRIKLIFIEWVMWHNGINYNLDLQKDFNLEPRLKFITWELILIFMDVISIICYM